MNSVSDSLSGVFRSAGIFLAGNVIANLLALLGEILIPRVLTPSTYGQLGLSFSIVSTISMVAMLGIPNGVTRVLSSKNREHHQLDVLQAGYGISILGSVIAATAIYLARFEIAALVNDPDIAPLLVTFLPYLLAFPVAKVSISILRAQERTGVGILAQRVLPRVFGLVFVAGLIIAGQPTIGAVGFWLAFSVLGAVLTLYFVSQRISLTSVIARLPDQETAHTLWTFSWPLAAAASLHLLLSNVDLFMLGYFTDSATVGYYRVIQPLKQVIFFFSGSFAFLFLPIATKHYTQGDYDGLNTLYRVTTKWIVSLTFPAVLFFVLFSPAVIKTFFGMRYLPAAPALSILMAGLFYRVLVGLNGDMVQAIDRPRIELYSAVVGVIVNVILNAALIPRYGIIGASLATVAGYVVYNSVEVIAIYRAVGSHPFSVATIKSLAPTLLIGVGAVALTSQWSLGLLTLASLGMGMYAIHLLSMILTRSLTETDLLMIEHLESRFNINLPWFRKLIRN